MIFQKNIIKLFFAAVLGIGLVLPSLAFAVLPTSGGGLPPSPAAAVPSSGFSPEPAIPNDFEGIPNDTGGIIEGGSGLFSNLLGGLWGLLSGNFVPTGVVQERPGTLKDMANGMAWSVAKLMVQRITQDIVQLIRTGGQGGTPLFVQDWKGFLLDAADQASGVFLKELKLTQLCEPFGPRLRLIFGGGRRPFQERFRCTVSAVAGNIQGFFNDFNNGGWQRWIELTQAQNNPYGQYLGILEEKEKREAIEGQAKLNEALSANGFFGITDCGNLTPEDKDNRENRGLSQCPTVTPGKYLENRLAKATNSDIEQLNLADSFNEILIAAFQSMINGLFFAPGGLSSSDIHSTTITNQLQEELDNLKRSGIQLSGIDSAINITQSIINKKEDSLAKIKDELKTLGDLKTCKLNRNEPIATVTNQINTATTTKAALEAAIIDQTIFIERLKDDRADLLATQTVEAFNTVLGRVNIDVVKTGSLAAAFSENDKITTDKTQTETDLQNCLNPPQNGG